MKQFSNLYIFCFSSALVLVVAAALSFTALSLEGKQKENIEIERQQNILAALGVETTKAEALTKYEQYIRKGIVIRADGSVEGEITKDIEMNLLGFLKKQNDAPLNERLLLLYLAEEDGVVVIPLRGAGLWGPIWGNVALERDLNTIRGATFDHASETPGLGAEINTREFRSHFAKKRLFDASNIFVSIGVEKPGTYAPNNHTVDGISGGTITSKALEAMIRNGIDPYQKYFSQHKSN